MEIVLGHLSCPFTPWRPRDGRVFDFFSYDTETTDIDDDRPYLTPAYVLGAACDGRRGVFICRESLLPFFEAHRDVPMICHNAAFDLKVTDVLLKPAIDLYQTVDRNLVWDTHVLKRLYSLATAGHTARGESGLADCARTHLGVTLHKEQKDAQGKAVRTSFGQFLGKPPSDIPKEYLVYLAQDALATWHLFGDLHRLIKEVLQGAPAVYGYVSPEWLREVTLRFGPLTHHIQVRASIVMDVLRSNGIGIDPSRREEKAIKVQAVMEACKERMRRCGYLVGEKGSAKALQSILSQFHREHPDTELKRTESGGKWSTAAEDLAELTGEGEFFADYTCYRAAERLLSTYLSKMGRPRLHPKFGYLLETGRTYCGGGFNLQNLPREKDEESVTNTIRGCFVSGEGIVFIDCDYGQIELVILAYIWQAQFGLVPHLASLINADKDIHRRIAAAVLGKDPSQVSKEERNSAKPVSFGRPGGMGARRLLRIAKISYGIDLTLEEVEQRIQAYHELCPELTEHLRDEVDPGLEIARALHLTPEEYNRAQGRLFDPVVAPEERVPVAWLGWMLLKVLREEVPVTQKGLGRAYSPAEIDFFWEKAQELSSWIDPKLRGELKERRADVQLWEAVRNRAGRRAVFTSTGRLRANTTFCSSRNCLFQGPAADGALLGLWLVWRKGYKLVDFVHDQLVVESPADDKVKDRAADIEALMKQGMLMVAPGMNVKVETVFTRSLNKNDLDPRYQSKA